MKFNIATVFFILLFSLGAYSGPVVQNDGRILVPNSRQMRPESTSQPDVIRSLYHEVSPELTPHVWCSNGPGENDQARGQINWDTLPSFSLHSRFSLVWEGPHFESDRPKPLEHGFTHLAQRGTTVNGYSNLSSEQRAFIFYNVTGTSAEAQPWNTKKSPWNNDLTLFEDEWASSFAEFSDMYTPNDSVAFPDVDIMILNIEKHLVSDREILSLRKDPETPDWVRRLSRSEFIHQYKQEMAQLHKKPFEFVRDLGYARRMGGYGVVPIERTFWGITENSWSYWTKDDAPLNYLLADYGMEANEREVAALLAPSGYYFYGYPESYRENPAQWEEGSAYLAYMLFQVEANRSRSNTDQILFQWMTYHDCCRSALDTLPPHVAQASAIFPFMSGAKGTWLWEWQNVGDSGDPQWNYSAYENYIYGLYRLSRYNKMFDGKPEFYSPMNPTELLLQKAPVWRGVINHGKMLVAAQNPYATKKEKTTFNITYQGKSIGSFKTIGTETCLALYSLK